MFKSIKSRSIIVISDEIETSEQINKQRYTNTIDRKKA